MSVSWEAAGAVLTIDLNAICENYRSLRRRVRGRGHGATCAAVLKADAYGLGSAQVGVALAAEGCRHFFVAHLDEGLKLRTCLPANAEIFVLHGPPPGTDIEFVRHRLIPVLNSMQQVFSWRQAASDLNHHLPAIVQVDTGMSRMGLSASELEQAQDDPDFLCGIDLRYLMSHLACAEHQLHPANELQLARFQAIRMKFPSCRSSLANSSGIFLGERFHFDLVRPGAALYGIAPVADAPNPMKSVIRLQAKIIQVRDIPSGTEVGYGLTYRAKTGRRIATLSVGYADGWLRSFSNRGTVSIAGIVVPIVGIVSMDTCTVDITDIDPALALPGKLVDLISSTRDLDTVAADAGTIGYELLTSLGHRYCRQYVARKPMYTSHRALASEAL